MMSARGRLDRLLRPRHIAVFGGGWAENLIRQCLEMEFAGQIWPVHPIRDQVCGLPCLASIDDLPEGPDAVFIGVNRDLTIEILRELAARNAGGAICFASGFAESEHEEAGGLSRQGQLIAAAGSMPILGPNCYGLINYLDGVPLWPDQHGGVRCDRGVAIVTQSSNIAINLTMQARALPLGIVATVGNQAQTTLSETASELLDDSRITALGLHIEGVGDIGQFERLADKAHALGKPIVAIKAGRSERARAAVQSHTASLAGSDAGADALFRRLGIARADSLTVMIETLKLLHHGGPLENRRIGSLSCSGGEASLMADTAMRFGLDLPDLSEPQKAALGKILGPRVHLSNPLDYHTYLWGDREALAEVFSAMAEGDFACLFLVMDFPRADRCRDADWNPAVEAIEMAARKGSSRIALVASLPENLPESWARRLANAGICPMNGLEDALAAAQLAADIGESWGRRPQDSILAPPRSRNAVGSIDEAEAKAALREFGLAVPRGIVAESRDSAVAAARDLGWPVVLKALGFDHKSEVGAVELSLQSPEEVEAALSRIPQSSRYLVEEQVSGEVASLILGAVRDQQHGFLLSVGSGGILTELIADAQFLLVPAAREEILAALRALRCWPMLAGYRGRPPGDVEAVAVALSILSRYVEANAETLVEIEINPFIVRAESGIAVDALIRKFE